MAAQGIRRIAFIWATAISVAAWAGAKEKETDKTASLENAAFRISVDAVKGEFSIQAITGRTFVTAGKLSGTGGVLKNSDIADPVFGGGRELEISYPDGSRDAIRLFPDLPFVLFRSTLHNRGAQPVVRRNVRPLSVTLDLGRPANELQTLGTGGLASADQNPGSYAWLAVADPKSRSGVVAGWLTFDRGSGVVFSKSARGQVVLEPQIDWGGLQAGPLFASRNYHLHGRIWYNDPDAVYVRSSMPIDHARLICSWVAVSGCLNLSSEWLPGLPADRLEILRRTMPSHGLLPRPVDLFEREPARIWLLTDARRMPRRDVVAIYNWESKPIDIDCPLDRIGLSSDSRWVGFDYWANAFVPPFQGRLRTSLPKESCRILALRPLLDRPFLVSTSRHVTQGMIDVQEEKWDAVGKKLGGSSQVIASDPYELRIVAPLAPRGWKTIQAELTAEDRAAGAEIKYTQSGACVRATITSPTSRLVRWTLQLEAGPADAAPPANSL